MAKLARLPGLDSASDDGAARHPHLRTRYYAFLSYSHKDKALADWLHRELERFRVPSALAGKLTANGVVPRRLTPIFRDEQDLSAGGDLAEGIKAALAASQFLIVLCSPEAAKSRWTNAEIESFKRTRPEGCVLAAVAAGEPFASDLPRRKNEECFPPALRYKFDRRGHQTTKRAEPLAADFRDSGEGRRMALLKLIAGMLGVGLDELVQRETTRRHRRMAWLAAASLTGMAVTSGLALTAIQARDAARDQRREAEGLVAFMLGDLKDKLEPIGRLDALDGVGARVLAYYSKQNAGELSDAALTQRSQALSLMAQVANARGDSQTALNLYRQAMAGTAEATRRNPANADAIFDHAQNVFYVGQFAQTAGDLPAAEKAMREYRGLASQMVALQPDNLKYRMEGQYAQFNLGVVLFDQRRFADAAAQFRDALSTMQAISTADPANIQYRQGVAESLAWLADADRAAGNYPAAVEARRKQMELLGSLLNSTHDVHFRQRLIPARRTLGNLYVEQGQRAAAIEQFRTALNEANALIAVEPDNAQWQEYGVFTRLDIARQLLATDRSEATAQVSTACETLRRLRMRDPNKPAWRRGLANCFMIQARLAAMAGENGGAVENARDAVTAATSLHTSNPLDDSLVVAKAYRALGDAERSNTAAAKAAWEAGLAALAKSFNKRPDELAVQASLLLRLGRNSEAQPIANRLQAMGYRNSE